MNKFKRLTLLCGHYGSGKTNVAVNLAFYLKEQYNMESFFMTSVRTLIVLPEHILGGMTDAEIATSDFWENPIGSGPCKFVSQIAGSELILETFDDYHLGSPQFSKLVFKVVSMSNYANVMMAGEADILPWTQSQHCHLRELMA